MNLQPYECQDAFDRETLYHYWRNHTLYNGLYRLFVKRLDTASRITLSNDLSKSVLALSHNCGMKTKLVTIVSDVIGDNIIF